jgi:hypothetical protein
MTATHLDFLYYLPKYAFRPNEQMLGWPRRHLDAMTAPRTNYERAIVELLRGWLRYATAVSDTTDNTYGIGNDSVLGPCWSQIGGGIIGLLDGETGRLDCGTLSTILLGALEREGFNPDNL